MNPLNSFMEENAKLDNDPLYIHLQETFKVLTHIFAKHIDIWMSLSSAISTAQLINTDASGVFHNLMCMNDVVNPAIISYTQMQEVARTFYNTIVDNKSLRLNTYASLPDDKNPEINMMYEFCKYFFIPARIRYSTIPPNFRIKAFQMWLTTVFTLPFNNAYTSKFYSTMTSIIYLQNTYDKLIDNTRVIESFKSLNFDFTSMCISLRYDVKNGTQKFIRLYMYSFLTASIEILKKCCLNIQECNIRNPHFDGSWISPFDKIMNEQINKLKSFEKLVSIVEDE